MQTSPSYSTPDRTRTVAVATAVLLATACGAPADSPPDAVPPDDDVVALVDGVMNSAISANAGDDPARCVGAVAAIVVPGRSLALGYGGIAAGSSQRPDGDTLFQIGSVTKVFTGLALARMVTDGQLSPDDLATARLAADLGAPLAGSTFTLGDLVTHHAGFPFFPSNLVDRDEDGSPDPGADPLSPGTGYSRVDLATYLDGYTPTSPPGTAYAYSNTGLGLLGIALADHLGVSRYHDLLAAKVTTDLGMVETWGQVEAIDPAAMARVAQGYALNGSRRVAGRLGQMGVLASAGEIVISGDDALRFLGALTGETPGPLDPAIGLALTPVAPAANDVDMGYAFEIHQDADGTRVTKGGNTSSYTAYLSFRRSPRIGILVMTSCGGFMRPVELAGAIDAGLLALLP